MLFAIGAAAAMFDDPKEWQEKALVTSAYFSGGIAFTVASRSLYLGFFEVINVAHDVAPSARFLTARAAG